MTRIRTGSAEDFIFHKAGEIDRGEFRFLFHGEGDAVPILDWYREHQNPDGGFPALHERVGFSTEECSCITMTLRNLRNLLLLGFTEERVTEEALRFVLAHQEDDGSFRELAAVGSYDVPAWAAPGDEDVALWHTTAVLCYALQTRFARSQEAERGFEYLNNKWTLTNGLVSRYFYPQVFGVGAFGLRYGIEDERFAKTAVNTLGVWSRLPMWEMPLILEICRAVGLSADHILPSKAISRLRVSQNVTGCWIDGFSQTGSPQNTIFALLALKSYATI